MNHKIAAGIVLFNPNIDRLISNIQAILPQVDAVYLIDNNSSNILTIDEIIHLDEKIILYKNTQNYGIAKALNQMCSSASSDGFEWILTLDQDSICPHDIISKFLPFTEDSKNVIICPQFSIQGQNIQLRNRKFQKSESVELCITSASLTRLRTWKDLNGFNEWLFIDCVDYDYCIRARKLGGKINRVNDVIIDHQVGNPQTKYFLFGIKVKLYNHSPFRNYYIVRNNIYLLKLYWKDLHGFIWLLKLVHFELKKVIFEKDRVKILHSIIKGINDGLRSSSCQKV